MKTFLRLLKLNGIMALIMIAPLACLVLVPVVDAKNPWVLPLIGFSTYIVAAITLDDFLRRFHGPSLIQEGKITLGPGYAAALRHTFEYALWPHSLNVFYSMGYPAFYLWQGSHPVCMMLWLTTMLTVTSTLHREERERLLSVQGLSGLLGLVCSLYLISSQSKTASVDGIHAQFLTTGSLFADNVVLFGACFLIYFLLRNTHIQATRSRAFAIGSVSMLIASLILRDFSVRAGSIAIQDGQIDLMASYKLAIEHTFMYAAWPHVLNVFCSLGFGCMMFAFQGRASYAVACWLSATVLVPLAYNYGDLLTLQTCFGFCLLGISGFLLWRSKG